jgi:predicted kinase
MKKVIILSGVSGSGKSTLAHMLCETEERGIICSADTFFCHNKEGVYKFDPSLLEEAHKHCFMSFVLFLSDETVYQTIIVDNTNLSNWEIAPYITYANYCNAEIQIMQVDSGLSAKQLAERNVHGVPEKSIENMLRRKEKLLPFWEKYLVKE